MPFHAMCPGCQTSAYLDCTCPPSYDPGAAGMHVPSCVLLNLDALVACPEGGPCCQKKHDHAATAGTCRGGHRACPEPVSCRLHASVKANYAVLAAIAQQANGDRDVLLAALGPEPPDDCPGGHCHVLLEDCAVCRPLVITAMPGSARLLPVTGG